MPSKYGFESEQERQEQYTREAQRIDPIIRDILEDFASTLDWPQREPVYFNAQAFTWGLIKRTVTQFGLQREDYAVVYGPDEWGKAKLSAYHSFYNISTASTVSPLPLTYIEPPERLLQVLERETGIRTVKYDTGEYAEE